MSLLDSSLWDVIKASFNPDIWKELVTPVGETLYMTIISSLIVLVFGIIEYLNGKTFDFIVEILVLAFLGFSFLTFVMDMAAYTVAKYGWTTYMSAVSGYVLMPALVAFGYLYLHGRDASPKDDRGKKY